MRNILAYGRFALLVLTVAAVPISGAFATGSDQTGGGSGAGIASAIVTVLPAPVATADTVGRLRTVSLLGAAGQGLLIKNGDGTKTLIDQNGLVATLPMPKE